MHIVYMDRGRGHVSLRIVIVTWIDLNSLAFILHFLNQFWIASRSVCSFCECLDHCTWLLLQCRRQVAVEDSGEVRSLNCIAGIISQLEF
jgi:hypothetical protein